MNNEEQPIVNNDVETTPTVNVETTPVGQTIAPEVNEPPIPAQDNIILPPEMDVPEAKDKKISTAVTILAIIALILAVFIFQIFIWPQLQGSIDKPVLYLYPTEETRVSVDFANNKLLTTTYPKFKDKWNVTVKPDGSIYDDNGKYYYALYWEEKSNKEYTFDEGFYVTKDNAIDVLEETLSNIGLNERESNEFIMYWLPILEKNKKSIISFELTESKQLDNKLIIEPKPDSLLRVTMHVKKVSKNPNIKKQTFNKFERIGFTAVEWGGQIHN